MRNFSEKSYLYYSKTSNIEKVEIFHALKVALLMRSRSERGTGNRQKKLIKRLIFYDSNEIEIGLPFHSFWNIFGGLCTQVFYSSTWGKW